MSITRQPNRCPCRVLNLLPCAFAILLFLTTTAMAYAQTPFFEDDLIKIAWPQSIPSQPCSAKLQEQFSSACRQIGEDGQAGLVFISSHPGFELGSPQSLNAHIQESEKALAHIDSVHVMQAKLLDEPTLMGAMDILRKDNMRLGITSLANPPIRQTSLLIPAGDSLYQIFIYLPMEDTQVKIGNKSLIPAFTEMLHFFLHQTKVKVPPSVPPTPPASASQPPTGALSLMPSALLIGGGTAVLFILLFILRTWLKRRQQSARDTDLTQTGDLDLTTPINTDLTQTENPDSTQNGNSSPNSPDN